MSMLHGTVEMCVYLVSFSSYSELLVAYPTCIWRLRCGWRRWNFAKIFDNRKLKSLGYRVAMFAWS